ncbi:putative polyketide synthase [Aspergillus lucknowensis]|uniref:Uncharacterized protein n=1 Tax=Aspergillus lucknowensis TaxID=176173 RepID=A0ABR4LKA9_9EURO
MGVHPPEPIAIVGSSCRFPGSSSSPSALWKLLEKPRDLAREIPKSRFDWRAYYHPNGAHHGTSNVKHSYTLDEDIRTFDAHFFNISPAEADSIDPQQRLLMETVYESIESAGWTIDELRGSDTAVYVGVMSVDYQDILVRDLNSFPTYHSTGTSRSIISNRLSYFFDWRGPSMTIDTACSSSLVAVHQGVRALRSGEAQVAIVAGAQLILGPEIYIHESKMNLLSPTGRSRMWDADADGYARGEGTAALALKRLSDAIRDGDHIECVIRETGINQDGRTSGLTVPSSEAQTSLIRDSYMRAGLDTSNPRDRPQYFEAHGTGTKAGDPREAAAIYAAFFSKPEDRERGILHVGSIKTVIGHTEGAAGIAGLLKCSLALQHGIIPPNLLFNKMNPDLEPYAHRLRVPTNVTPWPALPDGCPRRASVNSFGFGGTNSHVILESYAPGPEVKETLRLNAAPFTPFTFSAVSELSLLSQLKAFSAYLKSEPSAVSLDDLRWTLQSRRSLFPFKVALSATSMDRLASKIDAKLEATAKQAGSPIGTRSNPGELRVLGIFTGQGAQWPEMGAELIRSSSFVAARIKELEHSLATLPEEDRPAWGIGDALCADASTSRVAEAAIAQPLSTAVQIVLVDMLRAAGVEFTAVVGHSSGEIAAAYAAGFITGHDAIRISYYRGMHAKLAGGSKGQKGTMLAVGTSFEEAQALCESPQFRDRLWVGAYNSSASVTLAGDEDAIQEAKQLFLKKNMFARQLMVDTGYHSAHMKQPGEAYMESIRRITIEVITDQARRIPWYSTAFPDRIMEPGEDLRDEYWRDNMVNPVMFAPALMEAARLDVNLAIEIGPHPALKAPATQVISDSRGASLPYHGVLSRGSSDIEAFSDCLGFLWTHFGHKAVDFGAVEERLRGGSRPTLVKNLPTYQWDHSRVHWYESRRSRKMHTMSNMPNEMLGVESTENTDRELRWSNMLKASEIPWLDGHQLQGQTVFPAAGYTSMAIEASKFLAKGKDVRLFELQNLVIKKAITFDDNPNYAVETLVTLTGITSNTKGRESQEADFACYACAPGENSDLELVASCRIKVIYGQAAESTLPSRDRRTAGMVTVDTDRFYATLSDLGYGYSGSFRGLSALKRRRHEFEAVVSTYKYDDNADAALLVHPTMLDVAFQALLLADQGLWSLHVPVSIQCVRVNPALRKALPLSGTQVPINASLDQSSGLSMRGHVEIRGEDGLNTMIQVEGLTLVPFSPATAAEDRVLYSSTEWGVAAPNAVDIMGDDEPSSEEIEVATLCERLGYYYLRKLKSDVTDDEWASSQWHHQRLRIYMDHILTRASSGEHPHLRPEWAEDTFGQLETMVSRYPDSVDLKLIEAVGEHLHAVIRGETTILEHMLKDNMLNDLYKIGIGFERYNRYLAETVQQISHRFPRMKLFEIGAGTGGATKSVLKALGSTYSSYTYTDVSSGFFENAAAMLSDHGDKVIFKTFDAERTPAEQGFEEKSYDVVLASNVLHATHSLRATLENTRRLLKPGGYLVMLEVTNNGPIRVASMTGGLPGWWVGVDDGRPYAPTTTPSVWNEVLKDTGFAGIDTMTPERNDLAWPYSVMVSQAVDDQVKFLRQPLSPSPGVSPPIEHLVIIGTETPGTKRTAGAVSRALEGFCNNITIRSSLIADDIMPDSASTVLNLSDLDEPIFKTLTTEKMDGMKSIFNCVKNVLWIVKGSQDDQPYHMASVGFGRALSHEVPRLRLQFLDIDYLHVDSSNTIAEVLLRLHATGEWELARGPNAELLWTTEPELLYKGGELLVPRLLPHRRQNDRLNAKRRIVTRNADPQDSFVNIAASEKGFSVVEECSDGQQTESLVSVSHSILPALKAAPEASVFVSAGIKARTGETVVCLSTSHSSKIVPECASGPIDIPADQLPGLLWAVASSLVVVNLFAVLPRDSALLVHEPEPTLVPFLSSQAAGKNIRVFFSTSNPESRDDPAWITLHPFASKLDITTAMPSNLSHYLDLAVDEESTELGSRISQLIDDDCVRLHSSSLVSDKAVIRTRDSSLLSERLAAAVEKAQHATSRSCPATVALSEVEKLRTSKGLVRTVVDWRADKEVSVQIRPTSGRGLFSKNKTYFLIGLAGQMGQSICEWMADNGAQHICLASRHPKVDESWIQSLQKRGTTIRVLSLDVTSRDDLRQVYSTIKNTMPPIGGVANAAMVLHDVQFKDMTLEKMQSVLAPKIKGSKNLDELFFDHDLEFFLLFSSLSSIFGNTGQSNYAAANTFMTSLAAQRRKRGLAASVFDISQVAGIGYVERAGLALQDRLIRYGYMQVSESELHEVLAETIRAGQPNSKTNKVITAGIRAVRDDEEFKVPWLDNPRLSHFIVESKTSHIRKVGKKATLSASEQLRSSATNESPFKIMQALYSAKIQSILLLPPEKILYDAPLIELGIDSLAAVEVRSWLLKELKADLPVLKILGGGSINDLSRETLEKVADRLG